MTSMMRPGRGDITTILVERNTASGIEWVTKTTVFSVLSHRREQLLVEMVADDLVERAERLVHQHQPGSTESARAIETRCCMPPESCQGNLRSKPVRLTRASCCARPLGALGRTADR
jgi:hypothetical protein